MCKVPIRQLLKRYVFDLYESGSMLTFNTSILKPLFGSLAKKVFVTVYDVLLQKTLCHIIMQMAIYWWNNSN